MGITPTGALASPSSRTSGARPAKPQKPKLLDRLREALRSRHFLTHLATSSKVSASTQNQALSAVLFLYRYVLGRPLGKLGEVVRARKPHRLPVVLTRHEVRSVLSRLEGDKWLMRV